MIMIEKIIFENYKPFARGQEMEIKPITLLIGKNSSGKSSLTHLVCLMQGLIDAQKTARYKHFLGELVNIYTFHNMATSGLRMGLVNDVGKELAFSFVRNGGKLFLYKLSVGGKTQQYIEETTLEVADSYEIVKKQVCNWGYDLNDWAFTVNYIGPIRNNTETLYRWKNSNPINVGYNGEFAMELLADSYRSDKQLFNRVSNWMRDNMENQSVEIESVPGLDDYYFFGTKNLTNNTFIPLEEVGEGFSQVLPIIVQSYMDDKADISIMEQPALHLHPAAHSKVADRLISSAISSQKRYIIETHSENILLAVRRAVCNPDCPLTSNDVVIYFVDKTEEEAILKKIEVLENGDLTMWPTGVFGESYELMKEIIRFRK